MQERLRRVRSLAPRSPAYDGDPNPRASAAVIAATTIITAPAIVAAASNNSAPTIGPAPDMPAIAVAAIATAATAAPAPTGQSVRRRQGNSRDQGHNQRKFTQHRVSPRMSDRTTRTAVRRTVTIPQKAEIDPPRLHAGPANCNALDRSPEIRPAPPGIREPSQQNILSREYQITPEQGALRHRPPCRQQLRQGCNKDYIRNGDSADSSADDNSVGCASFFL
jgi:hypothetical protein